MERKTYTEKDFPIQSRIWYVWIPVVLLGLLAVYLDDKNTYSFSEFAGIVATVVIISIVFGKRKGFLVDEKGIRVNPRFLGGTTGLILYGDIERVYVRQKFLDYRLGIAATCIELKLLELDKTQSVLSEISPANKLKHTVYISGLLPRDAESLKNVIQERVSNPTIEDVARVQKSNIAVVDGAKWLRVLAITSFVPVFIPILVPFLKFSSNGKNILFFFVPALLTFLSYKYWRVFYTSEPKSPQIAYLTVYAVALLCVILGFYVA